MDEEPLPCQTAAIQNTLSSREKPEFLGDSLVCSTWRGVEELTKVKR